MRAIVFLAALAGISLARAATGVEAERALAPEAATAAWRLPPGFSATLFAGEPAIVQPMAFTFDDRGRVWVVENLSYPTWKADGIGQDRVTILEDVDGDGRHDKRTVFLENGANVTGIEVGFGGVWLTAAPHLLFVPDADGNDQPDGPPKILLEGWTLDAKHNVVGNLAWGPDGWLYGCNGITAPSKVGKAGTPLEQRQTVSCGVWRYHPVRHEFEIYANGTTNPWGIDWDERGQMFITNCVIKHMFHVVPGAHFVRMFGQDSNAHVYSLIESCADHQHWAGGHWTTARGGEAHDDFGGGHAHSGCMIYLGDNWPAEYRGNAFLLNIHGQRLNRDRLERSGSGYVARHAPDFAFSKDPWFRGLHAKYGPDGGVYISDWSDTGECHDAKEEQCDKTGGRIFKIVYGSARRHEGLWKFDLTQLENDELLGLQNFSNEWTARHARRLLQERYAKNQQGFVLRNAHGITATDKGLSSISQSSGNLEGDRKQTATHLRLMYTLHVTGRLSEEWLARTIREGSREEWRAQAATLAVELRKPGPAMLSAFEKAAAEDPSPFVRLHLASALQRLPLEQRWPIAEALLGHTEDASDAYLPLMSWYGVEPLVPQDLRRAIEWIPRVQIPLVRQYLTRRVVAALEEQKGAAGTNDEILSALVEQLRGASDAVRIDMLAGLREAYRGRRGMKAPANWWDCYAALAKSQSGAVRDQAEEVSVLFGDSLVIKELIESFQRHPKPDLASRQRRLHLLAGQRVASFAQQLLTMLDDAELRPDAIRALGNYDLAEIPSEFISLYRELTPAERQDTIQTLTLRPSFALALLTAIEQKQIPREEVSALVIRELQALDHAEVTKRLASVWGAIRPAAGDKKAKAEQLKSQLSAGVSNTADMVRGRAIYAKTCANCHKLFGEGGKIGPELTGSQRHNLDYVLENVLDPSAIVPREYRATVFRMADGRVVQGMVLEENPRTVSVQTPSEVVHLAIEEIEARKESNLSMMPEGLLDRMLPAEIQDLVAYLASPQQVPLPAPQ
jgi:putative membrane-bound dehydrogenase-like protein